MLPYLNKSNNNTSFNTFWD